MEKVENLNKENFFNEQMKLTPLAMADFCKFIDDYKEMVGWQHLFADYKDFKPESLEGGVIAFKQRKFHDIPMELQYGVIIKFLRKHFGDDTLEVVFPFDMRERAYFIEDISGYLALIESSLEPEEILKLQ